VPEVNILVVPLRTREEMIRMAHEAQIAYDKQKESMYPRRQPCQK